MTSGTRSDAGSRRQVAAYSVLSVALVPIHPTMTCYCGMLLGRTSVLRFPKDVDNDHQERRAQDKCNQGRKTHVGR